MSQFSKPIEVDSLKDCFFYHKMDLPGFGEVNGNWDLRDCVDAYLGNYEFSGKRSLDMGTASGFLSFEMEKRGADVVSFDMKSGDDWDIVPHYKLKDKLDEIKRQSSISIQRLKNGYWLAHRALNSRAQVYYGDIYSSLPESIGRFDVVLYGMILTHLRDPFQALYTGASLSKDAIIVTGIFSKTEKPQAIFRPSPNKTSNLDIKGWWLLSIECVKNMLGVLGFTDLETVEFKAICSASGIEEKKNCTAILARRPSPIQ